jgi:hypothetical protein
MAGMTFVSLKEPRLVRYRRHRNVLNGIVGPLAFIAVHDGEFCRHAREQNIEGAA